MDFIVTNRFDKVTRRGSPLGRRTVAGRIVKESYGAAKQQHTFTVRQNSNCPSDFFPGKRMVR